MILADRVGEDPPDVLMSSNLIRAIETAAIIADKLNLMLKIPGKDFRPWNLGSLVGTPSVESIPIIAHHAVNSPNMVVAGGESFNNFRSRFFTGLLKALRYHGGVIGIVTHHRCERLLRAWEKLDFPLDGSIDETEFTLRGEPTGYCGTIEIPVDRLAMVVEPPSFGDGREERLAGVYS